MPRRSTHDDATKHLRVANAVARRFARRVGRPDLADELAAECRAALVELWRTFDPARGVKFATFASPAFERRCWRFLNRFGGPVAVPVNRRDVRVFGVPFLVEREFEDSTEVGEATDAGRGQSFAAASRTAPTREILVRFGRRRGGPRARRARRDEAEDA